MKFFTALLLTETNSFSPIPTGRAAFEEFGIWHGDASQHEKLYGPVLARWHELAAERNHDMIESLGAIAQPAGPVATTLFESFKHEILTDLERALPVDVVLLQLHGAMLTTDCDDCEGDLLAAIRQLTGPTTIIGAELDLHCHLSPAMLTHADLLIGYKEYPHTDVMARAEELFALSLATAEKRIHPTMGVFDCRMVSTWRTTEQPMQAFVKRMQTFETDSDILSVSFCHGFPWGDTAHAGAKMLAITDNNSTRAATLAAELGAEIWAMRDATHPVYLTISEALDRIPDQSNRPTVIADTADNAGGGAPSDSTFVLQQLLNRKIARAVSGLHWEPQAVEFCRAAGVGAQLQLRLGGKVGPTSGPAIDLPVTVQALGEHASQADTGGGRQPVGDTVWVTTILPDHPPVQLVLNNSRCQVLHPEVFTSLGIALDEQSVVVVKSSQHFYTAFSPIATQVLYVASPGTLNPAFEEIPYSEFKGPYWPRNPDPFQS